MRVTVIAEWDEDVAFCATVARAVLGAGLVIAPRPVGGWSKIHSGAAALIAAAHNDGFDGAIVLADSDDSPIGPEDASSDVYERKARLPLLRRCADGKLRSLRARSGRPHIRVAIGLAVPSIEAWCLALDDPCLTEVATRVALREGRRAFDRDELKQRLYGSARAEVHTRLRRVGECAERIAQNFDGFERKFPIGFGSMLRDLRSWRS